MAREKVLALVLAGGQGGRMEVLTRERAKPALPYAGVYRLIDFALSNLAHSGIDNVWVVVQYETHSINDVLANGRPWDLDRTHGGLMILPPQQGAGAKDTGFAEGNADAIFRNRRLLREFDPDLLLVLSADHIYKLDYNDVIATHRAKDATCTLVTTHVPIAEASNFGVVKLNRENRVTGFDYKPEEPTSDIALTEVFVYDAAVLLETLETLHARLDRDGEGGGAGLEDFGDQLLPELVRAGKVYAHELEGYWKDVGRPETYFQSHMDLLADHPGLALDDQRWPVLTLEPQRMPAKIHETAAITNSLISPGCDIRGTVARSVLAPGVFVEEGATVRDTIIFHDTVVEAGASVQFAIVDALVRIGARARVGGEPKNEPPTTEELTLIGQEATIEGASTIKRGARVDPSATA